MTWRQDCTCDLLEEEYPDNFWALSFCFDLGEKCLFTKDYLDWGCFRLTLFQTIHKFKENGNLNK